VSEIKRLRNAFGATTEVTGLRKPLMLSFIICRHVKIVLRSTQRMLFDEQGM